MADHNKQHVLINSLIFLDNPTSRHPLILEEPKSPTLSLDIFISLMSFHFRIWPCPEDLHKYKILRVNEEGRVTNLGTEDIYEHELAQGISDFPRTSSSLHLQKASPSDMPFVVVDFSEPHLRFLMYKRVTGITEWVFDPLPQVAWPSIEYSHDFISRALSPVPDWKHKILLTIENLLYSYGWKCLSPKHPMHDHYRVNIILAIKPILRFTTHYVCGCIEFADFFSLLAGAKLRDEMALQEVLWDDEKNEFDRGARCTSAEAKDTRVLVKDRGWNRNREIWLQAYISIKGGEEVDCELFETTWPDIAYNHK